MSNTQRSTGHGPAASLRLRFAIIGPPVASVKFGA